MSEWQPIETAPKDGTPILLATRRLKKDEYALGDPEVVIGAYLAVWHPDNVEWVAILPGPLDGDRGMVQRLTISGDHGSLMNSLGPTHWMPLPEPPEGTGTERDSVVQGVIPPDGEPQAPEK